MSGEQDLTDLHPFSDRDELLRRVARPELLAATEERLMAHASPQAAEFHLPVACTAHATFEKLRCCWAEQVAGVASAASVDRRTRFIVGGDGR
jgi:hypothetical protein